MFSRGTVTLPVRGLTRRLLSPSVAMSTLGDKILDTALSKVRPAATDPTTSVKKKSLHHSVLLLLLLNADWREELVHQRVGERSGEERVSGDPQQWLRSRMS